MLGANIRIKKIDDPLRDVLAAALHDAKTAADTLARHKVNDATAELEDADGASGLQKVVREKNIAVEFVISEILARELRALIDLAEQTLMPFWPLRRVLLGALLSSLTDRTASGDSVAFDEGRRPLYDAAKAVDTLFAPLRSSIDSALSDPWQIARERLRADPHAALPDFTGAHE